MASSVVPVANTRNGFIIVTQVEPGGTEQYSLGTGGGVSTGGPLKKLLKGEPKALGTVQIMIGIMTLLFGIIRTVYVPRIGVYRGVTYWGSCLYITSGSLSVAAGKKADNCVVIGSLVMNIISAVAAGVAIVLLSFDMFFQLKRSYYHSCSYNDSYRDDYLCEASIWWWGQSGGISGVLLVFSLLEFIISICTSVFACKATHCAGAPAVFIISNPETHNLAEENA
ncbi:membrane-spanning 4-domains subfamily A member 4A-like [Colossoma macropomum]|uniref:membrane-spanning 4-domains subfamily A member 4A-like n=1 Tax=Colossoma macropomum TaxID=42526 RepID=UPI001864EDE6|nr:membrane-spanning 4-domains subfamily A member 4A-like [Colossoma macropomum]